MTTFLLALLLTTGWASHYADGVMESTVEARVEMGHLPADLDATCYVARPHPRDLGRTVWLRPDGGRWTRCVVADCGGVADGGRQWMIENNILVEVDYETAVRWGSVGRGIRVEMTFEEPAKPAAGRLVAGLVR